MKEGCLRGKALPKDFRDFSKYFPSLELISFFQAKLIMIVLASYVYERYANLCLDYINTYIAISPAISFAPIIKPDG